MEFFTSAFYKDFVCFFQTVLNTEVRDLRIVLQSADKDLSAVKMEYDHFRRTQEKEMGELSSRHMNVQLQLDNVRYAVILTKAS